MPIAFDPANDLQVLSTYQQPDLEGPAATPGAKAITACLEVPTSVPGPGGIREAANLPLVAAILRQFALVIPTLTGEVRQNIQNALAANEYFQKPDDLVPYVTNAASYVDALQTRDAFLLDVLKGSMAATR